MRLLTYTGIITLLITLNACAPRPGTPEAALKIKKEAKISFLNIFDLS